MERDPDVPRSLAVVARLLGSDDGRRAAPFLDATDRWALGRLRSLDGDAVWGSPAGAGMTPLAPRLAGAARRELALARLRRRREPRSRMVVRLPARSSRPPGILTSVRSFVLGGAIASFGEPAGPQLLDRILEEAHATLDGPLRVGSGGAVLLQVRIGVTPSILRVMVADAPDLNAEALVALERHGRSWMPQPMASGGLAGLRWSTETRLSGTRPRRVTPRLASEIADAVASLPIALGPARAPSQDLGMIASAVPALRKDLESVARSIDDRLRALPGVARHGDLWLGNVLAVGGHLSGIVDWDAYDASAAPGTDLLQLLASEERRRLRLSLGGFVASGRWRSIDDEPAFRRFLQRTGISLTGDALEAVASAWWATEVANTLRRLPDRAGDRRWIDANVVDPLPRLLT